jgi:hypothetical protein
MCCWYVPDTLQILVDSLRTLNYWVLRVLLTRRTSDLLMCCGCFEWITLQSRTTLCNVSVTRITVGHLIKKKKLYRFSCSIQYLSSVVKSNHPPTLRTKALSDRCQLSYPPTFRKERDLKIVTNPLAVVITVARDHKEKLWKRDRLVAHTTVLSITSCRVDLIAVEFAFVCHHQRLLTPPFSRASSSHAYETRIRAQCR